MNQIISNASNSLLIISQNILLFFADELKFLIVYDPGYKNWAPLQIKLCIWHNAFLSCNRLPSNLESDHDEYVVYSKEKTIAHANERIKFQRIWHYPFYDNNGSWFLFTSLLIYYILIGLNSMFSLPFEFLFDA